MSDGKSKAPHKQDTSEAAPRKKAARVKTFLEEEIDRVLVTGEEVILKANLHGAIYWKSVAVILVAILVYLMVPKDHM